jgi:uncharacterized membrane protein YfcA
MEKALVEYFRAEKAGSLLLLAWGFCGLLAGGFMLSNLEGEVWKGAAAPVLALAAIHMLVGGVVLIRTAPQVGKLLSQLRTTPRAMLDEELPRIEKVLANFEKYKMAESLLFFLGFAFLLGGAFAGLGDYMLGAGLGSCLQAGFTLAFDLFASLRAGLYQHELKTFERS